MSSPSFRDEPTPQRIVPVMLTPTVQRKAAPLAAWFMLTAVAAALFAVLASAVAGRDWDRELPELLGTLVVGGVLGTMLGGLSGLFDQPRLRGMLLGGVMGGLVGVIAVAAAVIPGNKIDLAFHTSALAALCVFGSALMGRWQR